MWLSICMMNLLLFFPRRVRVSRSTGTESWMPWYSRRMMARVTELTWLLVIGVKLLFSSMKLRRRRNCYSRMVLSLTLSPRKILSSRLSKPSSSANYRVERRISGTNFSIRARGFLRRLLQGFTICTPQRRQALTTKSEKGWGQKRYGLNNTSQPAPSSSIYFFPSLIFSSISPTSTVTEVPTPIFVLSRFASLPLFVIFTTGKLFVDLGGGSD